MDIEKQLKNNLNEYLQLVKLAKMKMDVFDTCCRSSMNTHLSKVKTGWKMSRYRSEACVSPESFLLLG